MAAVLCALSLLLAVSVSASDSVSNDVRSVPAANATRDLRTINEYWVFTTLENLQRRLDRLEFGGHRGYKGHRGFFHGYRGYGGTGATYTRWGRTSCRSGTELVYHGFTAGSYYTHRGGGVNYLCLPRDPIWGHYESAGQTGALVYGAEYELQRSYPSSFFRTHMRNYYDDAPCAVCRTRRSSVYMLPGRNRCYRGWRLEYSGYLMSGYYGHAAASEFVCLDIAAEILHGGHHSYNYNGKLFYFSEARCGSLPCPPYVSGRELTCAVCSK